MNLSPLNSVFLLILSIAFFSFIVWRNSSPLLALIGLVSIGYYTLHLFSWLLENVSGRFQGSDQDEADDCDSTA